MLCLQGASDFSVWMKGFSFFPLSLSFFFSACLHDIENTNVFMGKLIYSLDNPMIHSEVEWFSSLPFSWIQLIEEPEARVNFSTWMSALGSGVLFT